MTDLNVNALLERVVGASGWAIIENGEINVKTVSPTRRAAIINWLVVERDVFISAAASDRFIEQEWLALHDDTIAAVEIIVAPAALLRALSESSEGKA